MTQPAQPAHAADAPRFATRRNVVMSVLMVVLILVLGAAQSITLQASQDVAAALAGTTRTGPLDIRYKGMAFSRDHVLVAKYEIAGIAEASTARWYAKPWGHVELAP